MSANNYEAMLVLSVANGDDVSELSDKFKALIEKNGTLDSVDDWGKRRLAYPINYINEGYYVLVDFEAAPELPTELERRFRIDETEGNYILFNFAASPDFPAEFERVAKITDGVLRSLVVRK